MLVRAPFGADGGCSHGFLVVNRPREEHGNGHGIGNGNGEQHANGRNHCVLGSLLGSLLDSGAIAQVEINGRPPLGQRLPNRWSSESENN